MWKRTDLTTPVAVPSSPVWSSNLDSFAGNEELEIAFTTAAASDPLGIGRSTSRNKTILRSPVLFTTQCL